MSTRHENRLEQGASCVTLCCMRTLILLTALTATAAAMAAEPAAETAIVLRPARVFDGATLHTGWRVLVKGERIIAAGTDVESAGAREIDLPGTTLVPGL